MTRVWQASAALAMLAAAELIGLFAVVFRNNNLLAVWRDWDEVLLVAAPPTAAGLVVWLARRAGPVGRWAALLAAGAAAVAGGLLVWVVLAGYGLLGPGWHPPDVSPGWLMGPPGGLVLLALPAVLRDRRRPPGDG